MVKLFGFFGHLKLNTLIESDSLASDDRVFLMESFQNNPMQLEAVLQYNGYSDIILTNIQNE